MYDVKELQSNMAVIGGHSLQGQWGHLSKLGNNERVALMNQNSVLWGDFIRCVYTAVPDKQGGHFHWVYGHHRALNALF